jgi:hypothetical protein
MSPYAHASITEQLENHLQEAATETVYPFDEETHTRLPWKVRLYWATRPKRYFHAPKLRWPQLQQRLIDHDIFYQQAVTAPNPIWFDTEQALRGIQNSSNRSGKLISLDPIQIDACQAIARANQSMRIEMPMGAAKSLILA